MELKMIGSNGGAVFGTTAAEPATGMVYVVGQDNPGLLKLLPPGASRGGQFAAAIAGQPLYMRECSSCHGADRAGTNIAPTLLTLSGRLDAEAIKNVMANGRSQYSAARR